ncbi:MAG TPA: hypothetical protein PK443_01965 [bacterium]|nr:hypothetical protein [bacterium]
MKSTINTPSGSINIKSTIRAKKVLKAELETGQCSRNILKLCKGMDPTAAIPYIERIEHSSHIHHSICFCSIIEASISFNATNTLSDIRTVLLEKERIYSHFLYLNKMCCLSGDKILTNITELAINKIIDELEEISGHRTYSTLNSPKNINHNFSIGKLMYSDSCNSELLELTKHIGSLINKNKSLRYIYSNKGLLDPKTTELTGPFSWHLDNGYDSRLTNPYLSYNDPDVVCELSKKNIIVANDVYMRIIAIIEDIKCSTKIIKILLNKIKDNGTSKMACPREEAITKIPKGLYQSQIESPRGKLDISLEINDNSNIEKITVNTPSEKNIKATSECLKHTPEHLIEHVFQSMYISPMEIDK